MLVLLAVLVVYNDDEDDVDGNKRNGDVDVEDNCVEVDDDVDARVLTETLDLLSEP